VALSSAALVTLAQLKSFLGVSATNRDTPLELSIDAASAKIIKYLGYDPSTQTYSEEYHEGNGTDYLWTNARPITAVSAITVDDSSLSTDSFTARTNWIDLEGYCPGIGSEVLVSYTAGYTTIPYDIQIACLQIAAHMERQQEATGLNGLSSRSTGDSSRSVQDGFVDEVLVSLDEDKREMR
jgi:hypothetical protein